MSQYVLFTELSGYDSKQLNRFPHEPTDTGPDPLNLVVTLQKTMSEINHITATSKNDSTALTDSYSCAEHVPLLQCHDKTKTQSEVLK